MTEIGYLFEKLECRNYTIKEGTNGSAERSNYTSHEMQTRGVTPWKTIKQRWPSTQNLIEKYVRAMTIPNLNSRDPKRRENGLVGGST